MERNIIAVAEFSEIEQRKPEYQGKPLYRLRFSDMSGKAYELVLTQYEAGKLLGLLHHALN